MWKTILQENYDNEIDIEKKWIIICNFIVSVDVSTLYDYKSKEFLDYAKKVKKDALRNQEYKLVFWQYLKRIPYIAPLISKKLLDSRREKWYYSCPAWWYAFYINKINGIIDIKDNLVKYKCVFDSLVDGKSQLTLCNILMARITLNNKYYELIYDKNSIQYFDKDILPQRSDDIFVDCGGYDGETSLMYIQEYGLPKKIFLFEPDKTNLIMAKNKLNNYMEIVEFVNAGVGNKSESLQWKGELGASSRFIQDDVEKKLSSRVKIYALDDIIKLKCTFIKMDIEGFEQQALEGARKHIIQDLPVLAVCVYHKFEDLWKIQQIIFNYSKVYKFYLRHYTDTFIETVIYAIPKI